MKLPKLHLRDLFWLVLVGACLVAWWLDRSELAATIYRLEDFYQTPIQYDLPELPVDEMIPVEAVRPTLESPLMESPVHESEIRGKQPL